MGGPYEMGGDGDDDSAPAAYKRGLFAGRAEAEALLKDREQTIGTLELRFEDHHNHWVAENKDLEARLAAAQIELDAREKDALGLMQMNNELTEKFAREKKIATELVNEKLELSTRLAAADAGVKKMCAECPIIVAFNARIASLEEKLAAAEDTILKNEVIYQQNIGKVEHQLVAAKDKATCQFAQIDRVMWFIRDHPSFYQEWQRFCEAHHLEPLEHRIASLEQEHKELKGQFDHMSAQGKITVETQMKTIADLREQLAAAQRSPGNWIDADTATAMLNKQNAEIGEKCKRIAMLEDVLREVSDWYPVTLKVEELLKPSGDGKGGRIPQVVGGAEPGHDTGCDDPAPETPEGTKPKECPHCKFTTLERCKVDGCTNWHCIACGHTVVEEVEKRYKLLTPHVCAEDNTKGG